MHVLCLCVWTCAFVSVIEGILFLFDCVCAFVCADVCLFCVCARVRAYVRARLCV